MKEDLKPGISFELSYPVPANKTVPHLYPEAPDFAEMPEVFATGFMVGLIEWACLLAVKPYLDWPRELTVGTHVDLSHLAATPPGLTVRVEATLTEVEGRKLARRRTASTSFPRAATSVSSSTPRASTARRARRRRARPADRRGRRRNTEASLGAEGTTCRKLASRRSCRGRSLWGWPRRRRPAGSRGRSRGADP